MKRRQGSWPIFAMLGLFGLVFLGPREALPQQTDRVRLVLDWVVGGSHAPYFSALKNGYYREANLEVSISRGYGGADGIKRIAAGEGDLNIGETSAVIASRAVGALVKLAAVMYQNPPFAIYALKSSGIQAPKDLEGRSIGAPANDSMRFLFPAFAALNQIDEAKVRWVTIGPEAKMSALLSGQVDAITFFVLQDVRLAKMTAAKGGANRIAYADHGFQIYSLGLIAPEHYLKGRGDVVRRFLAATFRGYQFAFENPQKALDLLLQDHPLLDREVVTGEFTEVRKLVLTEDTKARGIGWISREKMEKTRDFVTQHFKLEKVVPVEDLYTTEYLPKK